MLREQLAKSDAVGVLACERVGNIVEERGCYRDMHGIPDPLHPFPTAASEARQGHGLPPNVFPMHGQTGHVDVDGNPLDAQWDDQWTAGEEWGACASYSVVVVFYFVVAWC